LKDTNDSGNAVSISITIELQADRRELHDVASTVASPVYISHQRSSGENPLAHMNPRWLSAINAGVRRARNSGPLLGHTVVGVRAGLVNLQVNRRLVCG
jgi:hypothetical protein